MRTCLAGNLERRTFRYSHGGSVPSCAAIALVFASFSTNAFAQTTPSPPAPPSPPGNAQPVAPSGSTPSAPTAPTPSTPTAPTPGATPSGYPQSPTPAPAAAPQPSGPQPSGPQSYGGYPQGAPPPGYAQPSYGPPGYAQPAYGQPGVVAPSPGDPAATARGYNEPALPPPPKRRDLAWSIRFDLLQLIYGKLTGEVEYAFAAPFSVALGPEYVFSDPRRDRNVGTAKGFGFHADFAMWLEGRPMRGFYIKAHAEHSSVTFQSPVAEISVPATKLGFLFGSQSIYGSWFTLNGGIGVTYDFRSEDRYFDVGYGFDSTGRPTKDVYLVPASGLFGNGFDLMTQLQIGGSF